MPRGIARDPCIKDHTPKRLRWFAQGFAENAKRHRELADELDKKAHRYLARANKLEAE
jgi:hypothetical protein